MGSSIYTSAATVVTYVVDPPPIPMPSVWDAPLVDLPAHTEDEHRRQVVVRKHAKVMRWYTASWCAVFIAVFIVSILLSVTTGWMGWMGMGVVGILTLLRVAAWHLQRVLTDRPVQTVSKDTGAGPYRSMSVRVPVTLEAITQRSVVIAGGCVLLLLAILWVLHPSEFTPPGQVLVSGYATCWAGVIAQTRQAWMKAHERPV